MNVLFLGYAIPKEEASGLYGASVAGNKMQINILQELNRKKDISLDSVTLYPVAAWPHGKLFVKREKICLFDRFSSVKAAFWNIPIGKQVMQPFCVFLEARKIIKSKHIDLILTFNLFPEIGLAAWLLQKCYGVQSMAFLADLPIDDTTDRRGPAVLLRRCYDRLSCRLILKAQSLIVLNEHAAEQFAPWTPYLVVEGGIDAEDIHSLPVRNKMHKTIVFAGTLTEYSGILRLMDAMHSLKHREAVLHIYGTGQLTSLVEKKAKQAENIIYHGKISHTDLIPELENAYLLVNPRPAGDPIAQVTFPSKLFEYMLSGTPVLTTKLNGLTGDYLSKVYVVDGDSPESLGEKIDEILELPEEELKRKAESARAFVLSEKTWEKQGDRIYQYIKKQ